MTDFSQWQENNNQYLFAALAWLRLRLGRFAKPVLLEQPAPAVKEGPFLGWFRRKPPSEIIALPAERTDDIDKAAQAMVDAANTDPLPALILLGQGFGLSRFEQEVLLLCAAMELDTRIPRLCAGAQDEPGRPYPTFALAFTLFENPTWDAISADRPLRYWRLIEINQPGATPLTQSALRVDERIVNYLKG